MEGCKLGTDGGCDEGWLDGCESEMEGYADGSNGGSLLVDGLALGPPAGASDTEGCVEGCAVGQSDRLALILGCPDGFFEMDG